MSCHVKACRVDTSSVALPVRGNCTGMGPDGYGSLESVCAIARIPGVLIKIENCTVRVVLCPSKVHELALHLMNQFR